MQTPETSPLIQTVGLDVTFGRQDVLRDMNLAIPPRANARGDRRERLRQDGVAEDT